MIQSSNSVTELGNAERAAGVLPVAFSFFKDQGWCSMGKVWTFLQGKKTIITALAMGGTAFAQSMGYITPAQGQEILSWLGAAGLLALRSAISKTEQVS